MRKDKLTLLLYFIFLFIYEEFIFHIFVFDNITFNFIYVILFSFIGGIIFYLFSTCFNRLCNNIVSYVLSSILIIIFIADFIYYKVYLSIISVYSMFHGGQVFGFMDRIIAVMSSYWYVILLLIIPLILLIVLNVYKKNIFLKISWISKGILVLSCVVFYLVSILGISFINTKEVYSNNNLYHNIHSPLLTAQRFGVITMLRLDIQRTIFGFTEKDIEVDVDIPEIPDTSTGDDEPIKEVTYNKLDIDWDTLINNEKNDTIKSMHKYFSSQNPTNQNDYTGMFKDKNLVVFVAEAFSPMAIDEKLTPNLYKLYKEGFQFDNFYTPLYPVSTSDGEYITDTSLIPKEGVWSMYKINGNYMPYSYANVFERLNYKTHSYHNNTYDYYHRDVYLKTMGYDSYLACGNGLEKRINCRIWPQSDYEMVKTTVDDYINDDHFVAYYMTVSGHLEYTVNDNMMATRNYSKVKDLNLSHAAKSYLATNIEFDKAIGELLKRLEESGKLENTVIAISGDHYPYGLTLDQVNELSSYKKDKDFELHHMPFLLWSGDMKEPIKVQKYASSLDVLPTLLNLFGIEYDSRLLIGNDILSEEKPLVIYSNRSFITDKCRYNSLTKEIIPHGDTTCTKEEVEAINNIIYNKFKYSRLVLENDYYRKLFSSLGYDINK